MWKHSVSSVLLCSDKLTSREHPLRVVLGSEDFTRVPLKWRLEGFLNARQTDKASPFRRNVMDKAQADHVCRLRTELHAVGMSRT